MKTDFLHFTICAFLAVVFSVAVYLSLKGRAQAKYFLWTWALLLVAAAPLIPFIHNGITAYIAGLALLFFLYSILLLHKSSQHRLDVAHQEIRRLLAESNHRMDEERRMIARQLHDEVNPRLVLAKMELQQLMRVFDHLGETEQAPKAKAIIENVMRSVAAAYQDSREIIKNTRIEIIDSVGLIAAVESLIGHYKGILERPSISLSHNLPSHSALPACVAVNVYRIIQEALLNAVKHSEAANITISVWHTGRHVEVTITDDGMGIGTKDAHGIGLIDMRERAKVLGSDLRIRNTSGKGTEISFSFSSPDSSGHT